MRIHKKLASDNALLTAENQKLKKFLNVDYTTELDKDVNIVIINDDKEVVQVIPLNDNCLIHFGKLDTDAHLVVRDGKVVVDEIPTHLIQGGIL